MTEHELELQRLRASRQTNPVTTREAISALNHLCQLRENYTEATRATLHTPEIVLYAKEVMVRQWREKIEARFGMTPEQLYQQVQQQPARPAPIQQQPTRQQPAALWQQYQQPATNRRLVTQEDRDNQARWHLRNCQNTMDIFKEMKAAGTMTPALERAMGTSVDRDIDHIEELQGRTSHRAENRKEKATAFQAERR